MTVNVASQEVKTIEDHTGLCITREKCWKSLIYPVERLTCCLVCIHSKNHLCLFYYNILFWYLSTGLKAFCLMSNLYFTIVWCHVQFGRSRLQCCKTIHSFGKIYFLELSKHLELKSNVVPWMQGPFRKKDATEHKNFEQMPALSILFCLFGSNFFMLSSLELTPKKVWVGS